MSTRDRLPFVVALSAAALLAAGCSSSGTIGHGSGSSGGSSGDSSGGSSGGSSSSGGLLGGSSGGSSGGSKAGGADAGCAEALTAIQSALKLQGSTNPQSALSGLKSASRQMHDAAGKTKNQDAKDAMNKVSDDLSSMASEVQRGKTPDTSQAMSDAGAVAEACNFSG
ncbi:MAG: hypothetical protein HOV87_13915 [Catenulispora sp.]|nr:hypothetical protein [Catenulispora sp.]